MATAGATMIFAASYAAKNDPVLMTVGGEDVRLSEFEYLYNKNKSQQEQPVSLEEYVKMFVDYKLKVLAAEAAGLDTTAAFKADIDKFSRELAQPYLIDSAVVDSLRRLTFDRMHSNVKFSHILIGPDRAATPEGQKAIADSLLALLGDGADFADLARRYSSDKSAATNGGTIGYISVGMVPYEIEDVVFSTPVGEYAPLTQSRFGTHVIRIEDKREDIGKMKARHILKLYRGGTSEDTLRARAQIDSIRRVIVGGADFSTVAKETTDEPAGRKSGGLLPWFGSGAMVPSFESAVYALKDGELSEPIETSYGVHLILKDSTKTVGDYESEIAAIDKMMERDQRSMMGHRRVIDRLSAKTGETDLKKLERLAVEMLEQENTDYANLVREYHDGLLSFEISENEVWGRANKDIAGLREYFEAHRNDYKWERPRFKGYILMAVNDSIANKAREYVGNLTVANDSLQKYIRRQFGKSVRVEKVLGKQGANPVVDYVAFGGPRPEPINQWKSFVPVRWKIVTQPEGVEDVKAAVGMDYEKELEKNWMDRLRKSYKVKINDKVLRQVE